MRKNFVKTDLGNLQSWFFFRFVSVCLFQFRFNRNTETSCFGKEPKQLKQTFCFRQCRNQFRFHFWLFQIKTGFSGHPRFSSHCVQVLCKSRLAVHKLYSQQELYARSLCATIIAVHITNVQQESNLEIVLPMFHKKGHRIRAYDGLYSREKIQTKNLMLPYLFSKYLMFFCEIIIFSAILINGGPI